ncbi:MAG: DUF2284 domain-containing protein [Methanosarcinaceae archaeon]|nr:DUF2284 domain-containing protein [Methanosarcinaceae archaeon]
MENDDLIVDTKNPDHSCYGSHSENLKSIISTAYKNGAHDAYAVSVRDIVVDERVRLKCLIPVCKHYGDLVCPPNVPTPEEFKKYLEKYKFGVIISTVYNNPPKPKSLASSDDVSKEIRKKAKELSEILLKMEAESIKMGYRFSIGLTGGSCTYCEECPGTGFKCEHPYLARPSMEAVGIDVVGTLEKIGINLEFPVSNNVKWWGLLIID